LEDRHALVTRIHNPGYELATIFKKAGAAGTSAAGDDLLEAIILLAPVNSLELFVFLS